MQGFLGSRLKKARTGLGLSQAAMARALGVSSEFISLLESDKRAPSLATLNKIASLLKKDIGYFLEEKEGGFNILLRGATAGVECAPESSLELGPAPGPAPGAKPGLPTVPAITSVPPAPSAPAVPTAFYGLDQVARSVLQRFKRYCDDYVRLERLTGRHLGLAPLYANISPELLAEEERRRLGLGDEPIRDIFALAELNGCRILRMPIPAASKLSGVFIFLEECEAAFALINSADPPGRQAFTVAHEYCHYLKDRHEGPLIDDPGVFSDEFVSLSRPREEFAQRFAAAFLMPASKVRATIEKEFGGRKIASEQALYLKRYFGVSFAAMLRRLRELGYLSAAQHEDWLKLHPEIREKEVFGDLREESRGRRARAGGAIYSDRYRLLQLEAARKKGRNLAREP
jgi:Zn-dependent peptidase ImmA (M78 family)/transcriptional regulator with XRE-family HTH domain